MDTQRFIARHVVDLPKSGIRDFFEIVAKMKDVISLGIGEPDFHTPWHIREAAIYALEKGRDPLHLEPRADRAAPGDRALRRAAITASPTGPRTRSSSRSGSPRRSTWPCGPSSTRATRSCTTSPATSPTIPASRWPTASAIPVPTRAEDGFALNAEDLARAWRPGRARCS